MTVASFIERMRGRQAALFSSTVAITRRSALGTFNESTASYGAPSTTSVYTGAALVRPEQFQEVAAGDADFQLGRYVIKLPVNTAVRIGDLVTVTASTYDAALVGKFLRLIEVSADEWQIARVCRAVVETVAPT